jgi:3-dehydroquinate synthase
LICDRAFFEWLEQNMEALARRDEAALARAIFRSCQIKAQIVGRDEREHGERALLNLGHTFAHAIEAATGYVEWLHGEAVGVGLLMAASVSQKLGALTPSDVGRVEALLQRAGLRTAAPKIGSARALEYMSVDKKVKSGRVRLVLLAALGEAYISGEYPDVVLDETLHSYLDP